MCLDFTCINADRHVDRDVYGETCHKAALLLVFGRDFIWVGHPVLCALFVALDPLLVRRRLGIHLGALGRHENENRSLEVLERHPTVEELPELAAPNK